MRPLGFAARNLVGMFYIPFDIPFDAFQIEEAAIQLALALLRAPTSIG